MAGYVLKVTDRGIPIFLRLAEIDLLNKNLLKEAHLFWMGTGGLRGYDVFCVIWAKALLFCLIVK